MPRQRKPARRKKPLGERFKAWLRRVLHPEPPYPIWAALLCALIVLGALAGLYVALPGLRPDNWQGVYVKATGFLFDLLFFGVTLAIILRWQNRRHEIARHQEEVQDFKRWDTEEGRLRIAGAVRRLPRMGKMEIDFVGIKLSDFSFRANDIRSIRGSKFYEGEWGTLSSKERVDLERVDFSFVNCSDVLFSRFNPFESIGIAPPVSIIDCSFRESDLRRAVFNGATMEWSHSPPETIYEEVEYDDQPSGRVQHTCPAFDGADLAGASFRNVRFKNADLREAENILEVDFSGAKGLETCEFDDEATKAAILEKASKASG